MYKITFADIQFSSVNNIVLRFFSAQFFQILLCFYHLTKLILFVLLLKPLSGISGQGDAQTHFTFSIYTHSLATPGRDTCSKEAAHSCRLSVSDDKTPVKYEGLNGSAELRVEMPPT